MMTKQELEILIADDDLGLLDLGDEKETLQERLNRETLDNPINIFDI